jgi:hypothetical protein
MAAAKIAAPPRSIDFIMAGILRDDFCEQQPVAADVPNPGCAIFNPV